MPKSTVSSFFYPDWAFFHFKSGPNNNTSGFALFVQKNINLIVKIPRIESCSDDSVQKENETQTLLLLLGCAILVMSALLLPDELWRRVLEIGGLSYKDLCCLSITCRRLHRLSDEDHLWSHLLSSDFPPPLNPSSSVSSSKSLYKLRFERDRDKRKATHQRAVLRKESQIGEHSRKLRDMETRLAQETHRRRAALVQLSDLHKVSQASVALNNVWQPEIIRGRQKQIVEQCVVPVESRLHALEMELRLCKQQISGLEKACRDEKRRLCLAEQELQSLRYHPLRDHPKPRDDAAQCTSKSKRLKRFHGQGRKS